MITRFVFSRWWLSYRCFLYVYPYCRLRWRLIRTCAWLRYETWQCRKTDRQLRAWILPWSGCLARTAPIHTRRFFTWNSCVTFGSHLNCSPGPSWVLLFHPTYLTAQFIVFPFPTIRSPLSNIHIIVTGERQKLLNDKFTILFRRAKTKFLYFLNFGVGTSAFKLEEWGYYIFPWWYIDILTLTTLKYWVHFLVQSSNFFFLWRIFLRL